MPPISSSLTLNSTYLGTPDLNTVIRSGNAVEVILRVPVIANIPNNNLIATLPYIPAHDFADSAGIGGRYTIESFSWFFVGNDGAIKSGNAFSSTNSKYIHIHFSYIAKVA